MKDFLEIDPLRIIHRSEHFFVVEDGYPVSPGHCLIISNALRADFFDLTDEEKQELPKVIGDVRTLIERRYSPDGYNIGMNCGQPPGQSVMHFHCLVIPRYTGDMADPKGGVRYCIPDKGHY
jgi:diadenosine tetraphosphate (Ap4A) HIT family hydrolase